MKYKAVSLLRGQGIRLSVTRRHGTLLSICLLELVKGLLLTSREAEHITTT